MKLKRVYFAAHNANFTVNENVSELDIRAAIPMFFSCSFGKRETFTFHRGAIICRHTVIFTDCGPQRLTVAYLFGRWPREKSSTAFCLSSYLPKLNSIAQAKKHIDNILDSGLAVRQ